MKKEVLFRFLRILIYSLISGIIFAICMLGFFYFSNAYGNAGMVLGVLIFAVAFMLCLLYAYDTYIIRIAYVLENSPIYFLETVVALIGNVLGAMAIAGIIYATNLYKELPNISVFKDYIINLNHFEVLVYSFFSGILIYFGINTYKKAEQPIARFLVLILSTCATCGLYFTNISSCAFLFAADGFSLNLWGKFFTILLGNTIGLLLIPLLRKLRSKIA